MAEVIKSHNLTASGKHGLHQPLIYCQPNLAHEDGAIKLNILLAKKHGAIVHTPRWVSWLALP